MEQAVEVRQEIAAQRTSLLRRLEARLEMPMALLGLVWLVLLVLEFTRGAGPVAARIGMVIWAAFLADFLLKFILAPAKLRFLRRNLLTVVSLFIPALRLARLARLARVLRVARAARGLRMLRLLTSLNRGFRALSGTLRRRGAGYVLLLSLLVLFGGAAGMYNFEDLGPGTGFDSFGAALWWTAMILVTMGSDFWPRSPEGRVLCLLIAVYGYSVFGYLTATLASLFIASDAAQTGRQDRA